MYKYLYINFKANDVPLGCAYYSGIYDIEQTLDIVETLRIMLKADIDDSNGIIIKNLKNSILNLVVV